MIVGTAGLQHLCGLVVGAETLPATWIALGSGTAAEDDDPALRAPHTLYGLAAGPGTVARTSPATYEVRRTVTLDGAPVPVIIAEVGLVTAAGDPISRHLLATPVEIAEGESYVAALRLHVDQSDGLAIGDADPLAPYLDDWFPRRWLGVEHDPIAWLAVGSGTAPEDEWAELETPHTTNGLWPAAPTVTALAHGYELARTVTARDTATALSITEYGLLTDDGTYVSRCVPTIGAASVRSGESWRVAPRICLTPGGLVRDGLLAEYRFDERDGTVLYDHSGNVRHGTKGATTAAPTGTGAYWSFGGADRVALPDLPAIGTVQVAFYVAAPITAASPSWALFAGASGGVNYPGIHLGAAVAGLTNEIVTIAPNATHRAGWCDAAGAIAAGWHLLTCAWDGAAWSIVLDGEAKTMTTSGAAVGFGALTTPKIASWADGIFDGFRGAIAALNLYSDGLTAAETARNAGHLRPALALRGVDLA